MARRCPACGRPNSDQAASCLYCSQPLEASFDEAPSSDSPSAAGPASDRHLIILAPQRNGVEGKARPFAEITGMTVHDACLLLHTDRLRLLRKVTGAGAAAELSRTLDAVGIDHFAIAEASVGALPVVPVRWLQFQPEVLVLGLGPARKLEIDFGDLLLLVRGEIVREKHRQRRRITASRSMTPGLRLHFYGEEATVAAELDTEAFDWDVLDRERSHSTVLNCKRLVDRICRRAPGVQLDRGFDREPIALSRARMDSDPSSMLAGAAEGKDKQEGVLYDNEAQFRFYARWRYLAACAARRRG